MKLKSECLYIYIVKIQKYTWEQFTSTEKSWLPWQDKGGEEREGDRSLLFSSVPFLIKRDKGNRANMNGHL